MPRGVKFTISTDSVAARRQIGILRRLGVDGAGILEQVGQVLTASAKNRITNTNKGPDGVPWPPSQRVRLHGGKTLYDKHNLENALRYEVQGADRVVIGVDGQSESAKNAAAHQFGSNRLTVVVGHTRTIHSAFGVPFPEPRVVKVRPHARTTNIPARPFLGVDSDDRLDVREAVKNYVRTLFP